jgi:hypothetical protein
VAFDLLFSDRPSVCDGLFFLRVIPVAAESLQNLRKQANRRAAVVSAHRVRLGCASIYFAFLGNSACG